MQAGFHRLLCFAALVIITTGCASYQAQKVGPTPMMRAESEIPEDQLLDVGILVFESETLTDEQAEDQGTKNEIRQAESHFIPYHLKNSLQQEIFIKILLNLKSQTTHQNHTDYLVSLQIQWHLVPLQELRTKIRLSK